MTLAAQKADAAGTRGSPMTAPYAAAAPIAKMASLGTLFGMADAARRMQAASLSLLGFGPQESAYRIVASGRLWRLRQYAGPADGPAALIVAAPIKRPYIWDLSPSVSAVRLCSAHGLRVFLLEWKAPSRQSMDCGLADYADDAIFEAVGATLEAAGAPKLFLMGHSLGGTMAAVFAALHPERLAGLVLVSAPLCFQRGVSDFRDALAMIPPLWLPENDIVPGSLLSQLSAAASPQSFVWSRLLDAAESAGDPRAAILRLRIEEWILDEFPLPARLIRDIFLWLYSEDRLCAGELSIRERTVSPAKVRLPIIAAANSIDHIAPPASIGPFLEAVPAADKHLIDYHGEAGVVLQHLGLLVGRSALASVWPQILSWIKERGEK